MTMMRAAALLTGLLIPSIVQAQDLPRCAPHAQMLATLLNNYGERAIGIGLQFGALLEILASANGNTWTIVLTKPDGEACVVAIGTDWQVQVPYVPGIDTRDVR